MAKCLHIGAKVHNRNRPKCKFLYLLYFQQRVERDGVKSITLKEMCNSLAITFEETACALKCIIGIDTNANFFIYDMVINGLNVLWQNLLN